jgi:hypothetical protein
MTAQQYIGKHCIVTVVARNIDPTEEYLVIKPNPKNVTIKPLKGGQELSGPREVLKFVRFATPEEIAGAENKLPDGVRPGAVVTAFVDSAKWKYAKKQNFVVLKVNESSVNIIKLGGEDIGRGWNVAYGSITGVVDVSKL